MCHFCKIVLHVEGRLLEPLAEVERALLVVEVLHAPHPELLGLLLRLLGEHCCNELKCQL